jgi:hypothetical protein
MGDGRVSLSKRSRRTLVAGMMLVAFASRALIPAGFMPAGDRPFSLEICREDFPADMLAHGEPPGAGSAAKGSVAMDSMDMDSMSHGAHPQHHSGSPAHSEHCVFGTACSAGPISHLLLPSDVATAGELRAHTLVSIADAVRLVHLPQPRAPPGQMS